jgi:phosphoglycerol transferase MdoB-like AlkP superfamily enzyme
MQPGTTTSDNSCDSKSCALSVLRTPWRASARAVGIITFLVAVGLGIYFFRHEGEWPNQLFVASATALFAAILVFLTRRPLVAAVTVPALITIVVVASSAKHRVMEMSVHAYDVVFYLFSGPTMSFLWSEYRALTAQLVAALFAASLSAIAAYRLDGTRVSRRLSAAAIIFLVLLTTVAAEIKGERRHTQQFWDAWIVSTFYSSIGETAETLWRGQLIEAADAARAPAFSIPETCEPASKPPHIVLIHQESLVPPSIVPGVDYDKSLDPFFNSSDGKLHKLGVETYGGASWLTEFSILTGVSTRSFGKMRHFVQWLMADKMHDTLPKELARCGYRNMVFFPGNQKFVSYDKFYHAIGLKEILGGKELRAKRLNERDSFFYESAMSEMEAHFKASELPLFTYILTMAAHGPYDKTYMPEVNVRGGGPGTPPEMHEYLRRVAMSKIDYEAFIGALKARFPTERFLIVRYGDHHPVATRSYLGYANAQAPEHVVLAPDSIGFVTSFAIEGVNYDPPPLPELDLIDVPFLGTILLEAARLPLSPTFAERKRLMQVCAGRYYLCKEQPQILAFHRRLIDSQLIEAH